MVLILSIIIIIPCVDPKIQDPIQCPCYAIPRNEKIEVIKNTTYLILTNLNSVPDSRSDCKKNSSSAVTMWIARPIFRGQYSHIHTGSLYLSSFLLFIFLYIFKSVSHYLFPTKIHIPYVDCCNVSYHTPINGGRHSGCTQNIHTVIGFYY